MKRIVFLIMMAAGLIALAACEEITNQEEQGVVSMTSFGFYMQDNPDLYSDVVIENITSNAITVRFPMVTPESAISSLVPRFEVTEGATVLNGNTQVISGETAVDFSSPVDLVVSLGSSNAMYTITVLINQPLKWEMLAQSEIAMADGPVMAISQTDGIPYLFGSIDAEESDFEYPNLLALSGSTLESVAGNLIQARARYYALEISPDGIPYVSFDDYSLETHMQSVMKVEDGTASYVGNPGSLYQTGGNELTAVALFPFSDNDVWCAQYNNTRNVSIERRCLNFAHYSNSSWALGQSLQGRNPSSYAYNNIGRIVDGIGYLMVHNQNQNTLSMYKYEDNVWSSIFEELQIMKADGSGAAQINLRDMDFDVASNGDIYILVACDYLTGDYNPAVIRYDIETQTQTIISGVLTNIDIDESRSISMSLDMDNIPYIVFVNPEDNDKTYITYMDANRQWSDPQAVSTSSTDNPAIRFAEDGTGYIAYLDMTTNKFVLYTNIE